MGNERVLYDDIGLGYNNTRQADPFITGKLLELLSPQTNGLYLDIGCGTGNYTIALSNKQLNFHGVEPSDKMLAIARARNGKINWLLGTAEQIPVNDGMFDGAIATLTIHHWPDIERSFKEIYRVLKHGSQMILFTATPEQMKGYWLNHYFPEMLKGSISQMPAFDDIRTADDRAGLIITDTEKYFIKDDLKDHFLYVGKNKPELYFDEEIRKGISSFSALSNAEEVKFGLSLLESDMKYNKFEKIKERYSDHLGDYLFITIRKN